MTLEDWDAEERPSAVGATQPTSGHPPPETPTENWDNGFEDPPTYEKLKQWEMYLPQHNLDLPYHLLGEWRCRLQSLAKTAQRGARQTFDLFLWGTTCILPLWKSFRDSPASRLFGTSPIVQSTADKNRYLFLPRGPRPPVAASINPYDRMLAIHL
ncbi:hypothetical protein BDZ97DRAFT_1925218 [Flammula alnicola]|nr:hypothetical protein BDZ97DRAFT_1925218 [Flammula alnicola]